ncbi:F-box only protein 25-like [Nilaparvata lugens]|uniref:F-box only protein 25-like n=1 Tax=Nilaparvata lugens TaxID=108931 RepID=UPI00193E4DED|nr:F-box only protein 25-like [Nilaparvata lugens]XP_039284235.1 F-box only protein 25-like [Nilaparvata lugens]
MPFISKDWRSPGEEWVKTEEGWEKKKILECGRRFASFQQENLDTRCTGDSFTSDMNTNFGSTMNDSRWLQDEEDKENMINTEVQHNLEEFKSSFSKRSSSNEGVGALQPHCHITIKCTKEIAGFNGLSDAFKRLDFRSAVHDVRRFNYICKLLDLLISHKLTTLSGCAQKVLFNMLEEVAYQVSASQQNMHLLKKLLRQVQLMIDCACWGRPLGSSQLWENHLATINRILAIANQIQITEPGEEVFPKLENMPEECVREVLLRLADHKDLEASAQACAVMGRLCDEQRIWRELCRFHFTPHQVATVLTHRHRPTDWQLAYHKLRKSFGLREEYAEMIQLCRNCRCLFWKSIGHPCIADTDPQFQGKLEDVDKNSLHVPIPPQAFLKFFSL